MNEWIMLLVIILLGAVIGGGTNIIAIRMLFRPYKPWFLGRFQVPFTPGLIPKRRGEIADNLGKLVEDHLVTPEGMQARLEEGVLFEEVKTRLEDGIRDLLKEERTLDEWMEEHLGTKDRMGRFRISVEAEISRRLTEWFDSYQDRPFKDWVPVEMLESVERRLPKAAADIAARGAEYASSPEGKKQLEAAVDNYLHSKGSVTTWFSRFTKRFSVGDMLAGELERFFRDDRTQGMVEEVLVREWEKLIETTPSAYVEADRFHQQAENLTKNVMGHVPVIGEWNQPLSDWSGRYEEMLQKTVLPGIMASASMILTNYMKSIMKRIGIRDIVTKEVNLFPLSRLEEMLLLIAKRELKMIALLGALIGGLVGFIQGTLLLFVF
ncbi:DUF445 family protein [Alkalicoccus urumqiensis]|uniref:DUF445 family protein n=1 Tax=Alkalicoccus urumqiensis TaxID=1548213 RepID=A0A2P6MEH2_ALKUR|nr:DUF445 family protein [Alkalicoccus urumqiensis]PRO64650.1 hypothetical protein C6I21_13160 [Alkalicoccus urumqiensis]